MVGGDRPGGDLAAGNFVNPTLFADVDNRMAIAQDEIFGPVLSVIPFRRGRGDQAGQRHRVRPRCRHVHVGHQAGIPGGQGDPGRDDRHQRLRRVPQHAVRRVQDVRPRPGRRLARDRGVHRNQDSDGRVGIARRYRWPSQTSKGDTDGALPMGGGGCGRVAMAAACGNAKSTRTAGGGADTQGVTSTQIKVGSLAAVTGPLGSQYTPITEGVEAYIDMVNDKGGVAGRKTSGREVGRRHQSSRDIARLKPSTSSTGVRACSRSPRPSFPGARTWAPTTSRLSAGTSIPNGPAPVTVREGAGTRLHRCGAGLALSGQAGGCYQGRDPRLQRVAVPATAPPARPTASRSTASTTPFRTPACRSDDRHQRRHPAHEAIGRAVHGHLHGPYGNVLMSQGIHQEGSTSRSTGRTAMTRSAAEVCRSDGGRLLSSNFTPFEGPVRRRHAAVPRRDAPAVPGTRSARSSWPGGSTPTFSSTGSRRLGTTCRRQADRGDQRDARFTANGIGPSSRRSTGRTTTPGRRRS